MGKRVNTAKWLENQNRWQINVQKDGVRRTFYSSTRGRNGQRECNAKADAWLDNGIDGRIKVADLYQKFLETQKLISTGTYTNAESVGRIHILPLLGHKKIESICEQDFQNVLDAAYQKGLSRKSIANIRGFITSFLKFARRCKATNLLLEGLIINKNAAKSVKNVLQADSINILFSQDCGAWHINAFRFLLATGLRRGELVALQWDRDLNNNILTVRESVNKFLELTKCKTVASQRQFVLTPVAAKILTEQEKLLSANNISTKYIFPNSFGERANPNVLYKCWREYQEKAGIAENISLHELRHSFVSMCKEIPPELLKPQMGHTPDMDTFKQYGHEMSDDKLLSAKYVENALSRYIKI